MGRTQVRIVPRCGIIHWTGNISVGASDRANRNFFDGRKDSYGSAQIIGDGDSILAAIPYMPKDAELAYHVGAKVYQTPYFGSYPNNCTIGYEMCVNKDGNFRESYKRAVWSMSHLGYIYKWNPKEDVMRHFDITTKDCPLPFLDIIYDDRHCLGKGWSVSDIKWIRDNLHIDGIQGEKLWTKYISDVTEIQYNMTKNKGVLVADKPIVIPTPQSQEEDEDNMPIKLESWAWIELEQFVNAAFDDKTISSDIWIEKVKNKTVTLTEVLQLKIFIDERRRTKE